MRHCIHAFRLHLQKRSMLLFYCHPSLKKLNETALHALSSDDKSSRLVN